MSTSSVTKTLCENVWALLANGSNVVVFVQDPEQLHSVATSFKSFLRPLTFKEEAPLNVVMTNDTHLIFRVYVPMPERAEHIQVQLFKKSNTSVVII